MEKIKFTQMFREAKRELTPEEKLDIIKNANPDKADEIQDEFNGASAMDGLDDFFEDYKDILDNIDITDDSESNNDSESTDIESTEGESLELNDDSLGETDNGAENESTEEVNVDTTDKEANDEVEETDETVDKEMTTVIKDSGISKRGKSKLEIRTDLENKVLETLDATGMKSDFDKYEEYFGYTSSGPKKSVKVMFHTPEGFPVKTGDIIKNTHPMFHTVCCMNEFLIWRMGVQIYNTNPKIKKIAEIFNPKRDDGTKIVGSERNTYIKEHATDTTAALKAAKEEIINGTTTIDDPFELDTNSTISQKNNLLIFMFAKIFPTIMATAKTGKVNGRGSCTAKVLGVDNIYKKLYQIGRGDTGDLSKDDIVCDLILDSFNAFLGGRVGVRASYENRIKGKALIGNANAKPLCIFDDSWIGHEGADAKNIFKKMDTAFSEKNPEFKIANMKKVNKGPGASKAIGSPSLAYSLVASGATEEILQQKLALGEITKESLESALKVLHDITTQKEELEPFAVIASTVASDFRNFLSCMTRVGARTVDVFDVYGRKFWTQEEIINTKNVAKRDQMQADNQAWANAKMKILNINPMSLSTPTYGKDGGEAKTTEDYLAAPDEEGQRKLKDELPDDFKNIISSVELVTNKANKDIQSSEDVKLIGRELFSLLKLEQFLFAGFNWLGYTPVNAWNFTGGYMEKRPDKALMKIKDWCRLALVDKYSTIGGDTDPHFGLGNTDIRDSKHDTLLDSLAKVRGRGGVWFMEKTSEGLKERKNILKFLEKDYENNFKKLYDFVKTNTKFDSVKAFIDSLGLSGTLWEPNSIIPEDIRTPANLVYRYKKNGEPNVMLANQDAKMVSNWVRTIFANTPNSKTFDPLVNPKNKNFDANRHIVDKVRDVTGIDLYSYFKDGKVDNKGILAALKAWSDLTNNKFDVFTGTEDNLASLSDELAQDGNFFKSGSSILQKNHVTPKDNPSYDRYRLTTTTSPELIRRGSGVTYHDSIELELESFFKEVFREANKKASKK